MVPIQGFAYYEYPTSLLWKYLAPKRNLAFLMGAGASSGIGAATAVLFSKLGARLALTGRKEANLQAVGTQVEAGGNKVHQADVRDYLIFLSFPGVPCSRALHGFAYNLCFHLH